MIAYIVDANICTKWMVTEEFSETAVRLLDDDIQLHAPALVWFEVGSALRKAVRRGDLDEASAIAMLASVDVYQVTIHAEPELAVRGLELSLATGQTAYDCAYLALAEREGVQLITADDRFVAGLAGTPWSTRVVALRDWQPA